MDLKHISFFLEYEMSHIQGKKRLVEEREDKIND